MHAEEAVMAAGYSFGAHLKQLRRACGLTQEGLAQRVDCSVELIRKIEHTTRRPSAQIATRLADSLGIPPDARAEFVRLARGDQAAPQWHAALLGVGMPALPNHVPMPITTLIGRARELDVLHKLLAQPDIRLLTLLGPPGVGKTRLALQTVFDLRDAYADGVHVVELASIVDPRLITTSIARALELPDSTLSSIERLQRALKHRHMLILLDNVEHLLQAAAPVIAALLAAVPRLTVLATSREPLGLYGEHEFPVEPLALPDLTQQVPADTLADNPSVSLFVARARAVRPEFALTTTNALPIAAMCVRLDGLPLAIELAAAQIKLLSPAALAARLTDNALPTREHWQWLQSRIHHLPERQRTLMGAIDWSYRLLEPAQQQLFARLSVFCGGFDLAGVYAVAGTTAIKASLANLQSLVDKSLVQPLPDGGGEPRFTLLNTLRDYALEQLQISGSEQQTREQHARYVLSLAESAWPHFEGATQQIWLDQLERNHDNMRAALGWALGTTAPAHDSDTPAADAIWNEARAELALRLAGFLGFFWAARGYHTEGRRWLAQALALPTHDSRARAQALLAEALLVQQQGGLAEALRLGQASLALYRMSDDHLGTARALKTCGWAALGADNLALAQQLFEESAACFHAAADSGGVALTLSARAKVARQAGDLTAAEAYLQASLEIFGRIQHRAGIAEVLWHQGELAALHGDYDCAADRLSAALTYYHPADQRLECLWVAAALGEMHLLKGNPAAARPIITAALLKFETLGIAEGVATQLHLLAQIERREGQMAAARMHYRRCLTIAQQADYKVLAARCLAGIGALELAEGDYHRGAVLLCVAMAQFAVLPDVLTPADWIEYDMLRQRVRDVIGENIRADEQAMDREAAIAYALHE
jgi:predicted ATPase/DNA-binding XRE family transcriptional regulator